MEEQVGLGHLEAEAEEEVRPVYRRVGEVEGERKISMVQEEGEGEVGEHRLVLAVEAGLRIPGLPDALEEGVGVGQQGTR